MSEATKDNKSQVSCVKCRSFWTAVILVGLVSFVLIGFTFLGFKIDIKINPNYMFDSFRYGIAFFGVGVGSLVSYFFYNSYCRKEQDYRDGYDLVMGSIVAILTIALLCIIGYYMPTTFIEYEIALLDTDQERIQAIKNLSCRDFMVNAGYYSEIRSEENYREYRYELYIWDEQTNKNNRFLIEYDMGDSTIKSYEVAQLDKKWVMEKFLECKNES